jgi:hypothetical protein
VKRGYSKARFTLGVRANIQPKFSIPIGAKVEISLKSFTQGVIADIEKHFSICPKLLINAELYGLVLAARLKKRIPSNLGDQFAILGANLQPKNAQSWSQDFLALTLSVKWALSSWELCNLQLWGRLLL